MPDEFTLIREPTQLEAACRRLAEAPFLALDTEFVRERTYYPRLCLVQVADTERTVLIDPLALADLGPLAELFTAPVPKVLHAARQDLEVFWRRLGVLPRPLLDTQVAAAYLGLGEQLGYAGLVEMRLDIRLPKGRTRSDWAARPLDRGQLAYAAADVRHLADLYPDLEAELLARGRLDWVREDSERLLDPALLQQDPETAWTRIKGRQRLRGRERAVLVRLAAWREETAQQEDVPRRRVAADELLLDLARLQPRRMGELGRLRGANEGWRRRYGEAVLAAVAEGLALPESAWPVMDEERRPSPAEARLVDALAVVLAEAAAAQDLSPSLLASRRDLQRLVAGERDLPLLRGWRREHGGQAVLDFLEGRGCLLVEASRLRLGE